MPHLPIHRQSHTNLNILNTSKTKEQIIYFRKTKGRETLPLHMHVLRWNVLTTSSSLGVTVLRQLTWSSNSSQRAQQRLFLSRNQKQSQLPQKLLVNFYRSTIENVLTNCGMPAEQLPNTLCLSCVF